MSFRRAEESERVVAQLAVSGGVGEEKFGVRGSGWIVGGAVFVGGNGGGEGYRDGGFDGEGRLGGSGFGGGGGVALDLGRVSNEQSRRGL